MSYWKVASFAQPSPIEQILSKESFTLEELLDEDDIIQECKSLNERLLRFLSEPPTVEALLHYLVDETPADSLADPKRAYKFPFAACEVLCCELDAVLDALLAEERLLDLLFSPLRRPPPLPPRAAGYLGRVVGALLLRKTGEMMQYLSFRGEGLVCRSMVAHVGTASVADVLRRLAGADDQSAMLFLPAHTQWLAETPLVEALLARMAYEGEAEEDGGGGGGGAPDEEEQRPSGGGGGGGSSGAADADAGVADDSGAAVHDPAYCAEVRANAADILTAIAHTQPSALAARLSRPECVSRLLGRVLPLAQGEARPGEMSAAAEASAAAAAGGAEGAEGAAAATTGGAAATEAAAAAGAGGEGRPGGKAGGDDDGAEASTAEAAAAAAAAAKAADEAQRPEQQQQQQQQQPLSSSPAAAAAAAAAQPPPPPPPPPPQHPDELLPALEVCAALLEPRRSQMVIGGGAGATGEYDMLGGGMMGDEPLEGGEGGEGGNGGGGGNGDGDGLGGSGSSAGGAGAGGPDDSGPSPETLAAVLAYVPALVRFLTDYGDAAQKAAAAAQAGAEATAEQAPPPAAAAAAAAANGAAAPASAKRLAGGGPAGPDAQNAKDSDAGAGDDDDEDDDAAADADKAAGEGEEGQGEEEDDDDGGRKERQYPDPSFRQETTYGALSPPLGRARLRAVELLAALLRAGGPPAADALARAGAVPVLMRLFERHPFHNLLHHAFGSVVLALLARGGEPAARGLLGAPCSLPEWLARLPREVWPDLRPGQPPAAAPLRAGYLGHVTQVGNILLDAAAASPSAAALLGESAAWASFVAGELAAANAAEDVGAWACGRPSSAEIGALDSDGAGADGVFGADLERLAAAAGVGGADGGGGGLGSGGGAALFHRYGALEEEEEEEEEEDEEDDNGGAVEGGGGPAAARLLGEEGEVEDSAAAGGGAGGGEGREEGGGADAAASAAAAADEAARALQGLSVADAEAAGSAVSTSAASDDDAVLLASDNEGEEGEGGGGGGAGGGGGGSPPPAASSSPAPQAASPSSSSPSSSSAATAATAATA